MSRKSETGSLVKLFRGSSQQADLILRIALGTVFFAHGSQKLFGWFGGHGWSATIAFFTKAMQISEPLAGLIVLGEFFGGMAIILGLLTRPAALGLAIIMAGAALKVHLPNGFFLDLKGAADGIEYTFVLFLLSLYLAVKGSGTISLDKVIEEKIARK